MTTLRPLIESDFDLGSHFRFNGLQLVESDSGYAVFAYGHVDREQFAAAVNAFYRDYYNETEDFSHSHVRHIYGRTTYLGTEDELDPRDWAFARATEDEVNSFPVTVIYP